MLDKKKYFIVFAITLSVFLGAVWTANFFNQKRVVHIEDIQNAISMDLQSSEIQYALLSELSCKEVSAEILSQEMEILWKKIDKMQAELGSEHEEIRRLKKLYSLLQTKDYILMKRINERCGKQFMFAFYFYGKAEDCKKCENASIALSSLKELYPELRVYSFDYELDDPTIHTLIRIFDVKNTLPATIIWDKVQYDFKSREELEIILKKTYPKEIAAIEAKKLLELENKKKEEEIKNNESESVK